MPARTTTSLVVVTWDGVKSAPFTVFINMPYSNYVVNKGRWCSSAGSCDCNAANFYPGRGYTGYVTLFDVYTEDLFGNYLTQVGTNEVLFNQLYLGTGGWTSPLSATPRNRPGPRRAGTASTRSRITTRYVRATRPP
jgi:hypothetical protein